MFGIGKMISDALNPAPGRRATVGYLDGKLVVRFSGTTGGEVLEVATKLREYGLGIIKADTVSQIITFEECAADDYARVYAAVVGTCAPGIRT